MKPLPSAALTREDLEIWRYLIQRYPMVITWRAAFEADRRDAELMLGLTGVAPGEQGICVAYLWLAGCVIHNGTMGTRIAMRGFEADYGVQHDITYFA